MNLEELRLRTLYIGNQTKLHRIQLIRDKKLRQFDYGEKLNKSRLEHYMQKFLESNQLKEKYARAEDRNNLVRNAMHSPIYISKSQKN